MWFPIGGVKQQKEYFYKIPNHMGLKSLQKIGIRKLVGIRMLNQILEKLAIYKVVPFTPTIFSVQDRL